MTNDTTLNHADRLDDHSDLPLRPVPTLDGRALTSAAPRKAHPKQRSNPARVQRMRALPQGVYADRRRANGRPTYIARLWRNADAYHVGVFDNVHEAAKAVKEARKLDRETLIEPWQVKNTKRAFAELRKSPGLWQLGGLTYEEQVEKLKTFGERIRMIVLNYVPTEDDPILAVAMNAPEPLTLQEVATLYGCTRERVRQIEAATLEKLTRFNSDDLELMCPTDRVTHWDRMGVA